MGAYREHIKKEEKMGTIFMHRTLNSCEGFEFPGIRQEYPYRAIWNRGGGASIAFVPRLSLDQGRDVRDQFMLMRQLDLGAHELVEVQCDDGDLYAALLKEQNREQREYFLDLIKKGARFSPFSTHRGSEEEFLRSMGLAISDMNLVPSLLADEMGDKIDLRFAAERLGCEDVFPRHVAVSGKEAILGAVKMYLRSGACFIKLPGWASGKGIQKVRTIEQAEQFINEHSQWLERVLIEVNFGSHTPMSFGRMIENGELQAWATQQLCVGPNHKGNIIGELPGVDVDDVVWMQEASQPLFEHFFKGRPWGIVVFDAMKGQNGSRALCEANVRESSSSGQLRLHKQVLSKTRLKEMTSINLTVRVELSSFEELSKKLGLRLGWVGETIFLPSLFVTAPKYGYANFHAQASSYATARRTLVEGLTLLNVDASEYDFLPLG